MWGPLALTLRLIHSEPPVAHPAAQASSSGSASHRLLLWEVVILCIHQLISPVLGAAVCPVTSLLSNLRELVGFSARENRKLVHEILFNGDREFDY